MGDKLKILLKQLRWQSHTGNSKSEIHMRENVIFISFNYDNVDTQSEFARPHPFLPSLSLPNR